MTPERVDAWIIRGGLLLITCGVVFALGAMLPRLVIPEERGDWSGSQGAAAFYARNRVQGAGGTLTQLMRTQISVVDIDPGLLDAIGAIESLFRPP